MPELLTITTRDTPAGIIVALAGQADVTNSGRLVEALMGQLPAGVTRLIVDIARLSYMDSIALRALVMAARVLKNRGGRLTVIHPQKAVTRLLAVTGADTLMFIQAAGGSHDTGRAGGL
jgi:anti-anti-sigma factor